VRITDGPDHPAAPAAARHPVLGVEVAAVNYETAVAAVRDAAREQRSLTVSALAVHGVMTGVLDRAHRTRLNALDLLVPDGQPVRWALNLLHGAGLADRVYGPNLTLEVCAMAEAEGLPVAFYGSRPEVLEALCANLRARFPRLRIAAAMPSRFRRVARVEQAEIAAELAASGARIIFVGLGCPRQEVWLYEHRELLRMPLLAVGAAFDFHAGRLPQAPAWMQRRGLEWLFRLGSEPARLWRRYLLLNPLYLALLVLQATGVRRADQLSAQEAPHEGFA
jgi:exopolysaccharide biosynthesis WecB/TagA/CpsF family protein